MVLATLLITGILVVLFGELPSFAKKIFQPTYTLRLWFPEGRGLAVDALVRRNGILVGRVTDIGFASEEKDLKPPGGVSEDEYNSGILVTAEIEKQVKLYKHDLCSIQSDLLGKPTLHFLRPEDRLPGKELLDVTQLQRGVIAPDPLDSLSAVTETFAQLTPNINKASMAMADAGKSIDAAADRVTALLDDDMQAQLKKAIAGMNESMAAFQNLIGDPQTQEDLKAALKELPDSLGQIKSAMEEAQARLKEMQGFTEALGNPQTVGQLERSVKHLDQVMADLAVFSDALKNPQGSLGLLLHDRQLYDRFNNVARRVDELSRKLEPIVDDVRVFTNKIARHPESLGVRGALQRSPGIK